MTDTRPLHHRLSADEYDALKRLARQRAVQLRNEAIAAAFAQLAAVVHRTLRRLPTQRRARRLREI